MTIENTSTEKFGVARGDEVLRLAGTIEEAKQHHDYFSRTMEQVGLTPDVDLITVTEKVTYSKPKPYVEPQVEPAVEVVTDPAAEV
jgi:hypothetical protein